MLDTMERVRAIALFCDFFTNNPDYDNPTDPNCKAKYDFIIEIGWENLALMQRARKANTKENGYPYPWTKGDFWRSAGFIFSNLGEDVEL